MRGDDAIRASASEVVSRRSRAQAPVSACSTPTVRPRPRIVLHQRLAANAARRLSAEYEANAPVGSANDEEFMATRSNVIATTPMLRKELRAPRAHESS